MQCPTVTQRHAAVYRRLKEWSRDHHSKLKPWRSILTTISVSLISIDSGHKTFENQLFQKRNYVENIEEHAGLASRRGTMPFSKPTVYQIEKIINRECLVDPRDTCNAFLSAITTFCGARCALTVEMDHKLDMRRFRQCWDRSKLCSSSSGRLKLAISSNSWVNLRSAGPRSA